MVEIEITWLWKWLHVVAEEEEIIYVGHCVNCDAKIDPRQGQTVSTAVTLPYILV